MASWNMYANFAKRQLNGNAANIDSGGGTVKIALITSAVAPNQNSDATWSGAAYTEVSGTNYTSGGLSIAAGQSISLSGATTTFKTSTTVSWLQSGSGFSNARYAVVYDSTSGNLICYGDFGGSVGNVAADLTITGLSTAIFTSP